MARSKGFVQQHALSFDQQIYRMSVVWPNFNLVQARRQVEAIWKGLLQPSPLSENYLVHLGFQPGWNPRVRVLAPELTVRGGFKDLPHINPDGSLCLSVLGDWHPWMHIADYVVPWASTWLFFYEIWFATGNWFGGGTHPDKPEHRRD